MGIVTRWWWVRHAPVTGWDGIIYGDEDVSCDTSDRSRFEALAKALPDGAVWVTSHLARAVETARAIAEAGLPAGNPIQVPDLKEQGFGDWQGQRWDDLRRADGGKYAAFWEDPAHNAAPGGESFADLMQRTGRAVEHLNGEQAGRDIIAVAHGGTIRAALALALEISPVRALGIKISNLSLTRIEHISGGILNGHGGTWRVSGVNLKP